MRARYTFPGGRRVSHNNKIAVFIRVDVSAVSYSFARPDILHPSIHLLLSVHTLLILPHSLNNSFIKLLFHSCHKNQSLAFKPFSQHKFINHVFPLKVTLYDCVYLYFLPPLLACKTASIFNASNLDFVGILQITPHRHILGGVHSPNGRQQRWNIPKQWSPYLQEWTVHFGWQADSDF